MQYRRLGKSGLEVSALSFGSWLTFGQQIGDDLAERLMVEAYEAGINFFDNAEAYANGRSEEVMGKILKKHAWPRETWLVSSKVFFGTRGYTPAKNLPNTTGLSRKHIVEACHAALRRLQVDYLDLYLCHRPDRETPVEETVRAMSDLIQQGKVLYWGTSEWQAWEIMEAYSVARQYNLVPPIVEQPQYNMFHRQKVDHDYLKLYREIGLGTTIWSPLASGLLSGKYQKGTPEQSRLSNPSLGWLKDKLMLEENLKRVDALSEIAKGLNTSLPCLAIAWCLANPGVSTVITGASKLEHLKENLGALEVLNQLSPDVMEQIEGVLNNKPVSGIF